MPGKSKNIQFISPKDIQDGRERSRSPPRRSSIKRPAELKLRKKTIVGNRPPRKVSEIRKKKIKDFLKKDTGSKGQLGSMDWMDALIDFLSEKPGDVVYDDVRHWLRGSCVIEKLMIEISKEQDEQNQKRRSPSSDTTMIEMASQDFEVVGGNDAKNTGDSLKPVVNGFADPTTDFESDEDTSGDEEKMIAFSSTFGKLENNSAEMNPTKKSRMSSSQPIMNSGVQIQVPHCSHQRSPSLVDLEFSPNGEIENSANDLGQKGKPEQKENQTGISGADLLPNGESIEGQSGSQFGWSRQFDRVRECSTLILSEIEGIKANTGNIMLQLGRLDECYIAATLLNKMVQQL